MCLTQYGARVSERETKKFLGFTIVPCRLKCGYEQCDGNDGKGNETSIQLSEIARYVVPW